MKVKIVRTLGRKVSGGKREILSHIRKLTPKNIGLRPGELKYNQPYILAGATPMDSTNHGLKTFREESLGW